MRLRVKAKPVQDCTGPCLGRMGLNVRQTCVYLCNPAGIGRGVGLRHQGGTFCICGQNGIDQADLVAGHLLGDAADAGAARQVDLALVQHQFLADQLEKGGLASPVATNQPDLVPSRDHRRGGVDQGSPFDGEGYVTDGQHGRGVAGRSGLVNTPVRIRQAEAGSAFSTDVKTPHAS